jgi:hypothetical protein
VAQRRELLAGLLGADRVAGPARIELGSEELAADVRELLHGLGFQSAVTADAPGCHVIRFTDALPWRYVVAVKPVPSVPVRCVQVDNDDHLYLAGRAMIPTHNSALALDFARSATIRHQLPTVVFSLEMGRNEITMRLLSAEARADERRRLGPAGPADERGRGRAAVHRRLAEHVAYGDQGQVPSAQAATRPQAGDHRLPAADVLA